MPRDYRFFGSRASVARSILCAQFKKRYVISTNMKGDKMNGMQLFQASIKKVFDNLNEALAVSGLIWIGLTAIQILFLHPLSADISLVQGDQVVLPPNLMLLFFLLMLVQVFASCWVAVGWHRFVVLGERPKSAIGVLLTIAGLLAMSAMTALLGGSQTLLIIGIGAIFFIFYIMSLRLSPVLVAAATSSKVKLSKAFEITKPYVRTLAELVVLNLIALAVISVLGAVFSTGILATIYSLIFGWIILMVSVSQISLIYEKIQNEI